MSEEVDPELLALAMSPEILDLATSFLSFEPKPEPVYGPSPIKRVRRTGVSLEDLRTGLIEILRDENPATVRHIFYMAVSRGLVEKTEAEYKNGIVRNLTILRRQGRIPYSWIADNTRWILRSRTYRSEVEAIRDVARLYRRNLWDGKNVRVEIWCEKDAIASLLSEVADEFTVPVMVFRGYSSVSYLYSLAEEIKSDGLPTFVYYFGDHDPSGVDIQRYVTKTVRELAPDAEIHVERAAVTPEQIRAFNLPTRPTKKTDSRSKGFEGESIEVDALPSSVLRQLVADSILRHVHRGEVEHMRAIEESERSSLMILAQAWSEA